MIHLSNPLLTPANHVNSCTQALRALVVYKGQREEVRNNVVIVTVNRVPCLLRDIHNMDLLQFGIEYVVLHMCTPYLSSA
jgi:hypothetical protein